MTHISPHQPRVLLLSPLPPGGGALAARATKLVHAFDLAGAAVTTLDAPGTSFASVHLHFTPKRRYRRESDVILAAQWDLALLAPAALNLTAIRQPSRYKWAAQACRHIGFFWRAARHARRVVIIPGDQHGLSRLIFWAVALGLICTRPLAVRFSRGRNATRLAGRYLPHGTRRETDTPAEDTLLRIAGHGLRLSPAWLRRARAHAPAVLAAQLAPVLQAIQTHARNAPAPFRTPPIGQQTRALLPAMNEVLFTNDAPIGAFALHLRDATQNRDRFAIAQNSGRQSLLNWYIQRAPQDLDLALPLPEPLLDAYLGRTKTDDLVALLQNKLPRLANRFTAHPGGQLAADYETLLFLGGFNIDLARFAPELVATFRASVGELNIFQLMTAALAHAPVSARHTLDAPWDSIELAQWFQSHVVAQAPALSCFETLPRMTAPPRLAVFGPGGTSGGLAANASMSQRACRGLNVSRATALHHVNADAIAQNILRHGTGGAFNIGFLLWETEQIPLNHHFANAMLDAIWAPTHFIADTYRRAFDRPVTWIGKGIALPEVTPNPHKNPNHHLVICAFDAHASVVRKNPLAAVQAFQAAFAGDADARMIVKTTPLPTDHWGDPEGQMAMIADIAARDARISIDTRHLPFAEFLGLIASADTLVSSHRAEGFGYLPAYALALGRPVVATDYSGSRDFVSAQTAYPAAWDAREIRPGETIYPLQHSSWAQARIESLAEHLLAIRNDPDTAARRAAAGQRLMHSTYSMAAQTARYRDALRDLGLLTECSPNVHLGHDHTNRQPALT